MIQYFLKKPISYAQYLQDLFVEMVFFNKATTGYFIDIGAYDGIKFSNSYYFEIQKNWKGICVEPNEKIFKQLRQNRNCTLVKGVVTNLDGDLEYMRVDGDGAMLSGIIKNFDDKHKIRIEKNTQTFGGSTAIETVQSYSIKNLIKNNLVQKIDLLSIDTEGSEIEILENFPFHKIKPTIILVENNYRTNAFKDLLSKHGYNFCFRLGDDIFYNGNITLTIKYKIWVFRLIKKLKLYTIGYN